jgi:hypothetical protein
MDEFSSKTSVLKYFYFSDKPAWEKSAGQSLVNSSRAVCCLPAT